jgi:para-nitrobenzyl esterase
VIRLLQLSSVWTASVAVAIGARLLLPPVFAPDPPRVTIDAGVLEGSVDSASGVLLFQGIPYAAPPVGDRRWRAPRDVASWKGIRRADRLGPNCMQTKVYDDIDPFAAGVSEDCLNLNVWTTRRGGGEARPVMVWIHGGGFTAGFGGEERHNGAVLAKKGVVVVTLNYRLGSLGFLSHPALAEKPDGPAGNYGLLDQIAALRWVKRNIARFGGDPNRVTIFGESAGASSVAALIASPLAKGLFHRAILQSGTGIGASHQPRRISRDESMRLAAKLGVTATGSEAAATLRAASADSILAASRVVQPNGDIGWLARRPSIDGFVLPNTVDSLLARGGGNMVPVIVGSNKDEGDAQFGAPARAFARLLTNRGARVYRYHFSRVGDDSASRRRGAYHSADITFAFGRSRPILANAGRTAYDSTLAEAMSDYWVSFATTGDPNGGRARQQGRPTWPVYDPATDTYLELGPEIAAGRDLKRAVYDSLDAIGRARGEVRP